MALSNSQLLMLDILIYADDYCCDNKTVGEIIEEMKNDLDNGESIEGGMMTNDDWRAIIANVEGDPTLLKYTVQKYKNNTDTGMRATCFVDNVKHPTDVNVVFRGTSGAYEWRDNGQGGYKTDTEQQQAAADYINGLPLEYGDAITVTGHSKGGNKAQYVTIATDRISRCVSYDGQGFSQEFVDEYRDKIDERAARIENISASKDYVNCLLYSIAGTKTYVITEEQDNFFHYHKPSILLDENGDLRPAGNQSALSKFINEYTTYIISNVPEPQRSEALDAAMDIVIELQDLEDDAITWETIKDVLPAVGYLDDFALDYFSQHASDFLGTSKGGRKGVVRDFTEATKQRLSGEIDDINKSTWSPVTDAIGDVFSYAGKWLGIISLKDDMSNVESYQRTVLDMTDMTKKELEQIFEDVYDIDKDYKGKFAEIVENEIAYNDRLKFLFDLIKPNFSICSAATIRKDIGAYDEKLRTTSNKTNATFEKEVDWAAKQAALEATKGTISSLFKAAVDIVCLPASMIKNIATGNPIGIATDTWNIIDDVFAVGSNLVGLASLGLGYAIGGISGNTNVKNEAVKYSEAYGGASGLTDALKAEEEINGEGGLITGMRKVSETIDTASAAYGLFSDCKDFLESPEKMMDFDFGFKEYSPIKKADMIEEYQDDYRKWQSLYRNYVKDNHVIELKNISNAKSFFDPVIDYSFGDTEALNDHGKAALEKSNKWYKAFGDAYDLGEDISELLGLAS